jgi:hypothetical protein
MKSGYLTPIGVRSLSRNAQQILNEMSKRIDSPFSHKFHHNKMNNNDKLAKFHQKMFPFQKHRNQV